MDGSAIADGPPQSKAETDSDDESTYIDALTLQLRHDTSDIYIPLPGNELALQVRRSVSPELWGNHPGLKPEEYPDRPFGECWSSSLSPQVKVGEFITTNPPSPIFRREPDFTEVTDENGQTYRYVLIWKPEGHDSNGGVVTRIVPGFVPVPSNRSDLDATLNKLEVIDITVPRAQWKFRFTRKFGTVIEFDSPTEHRSYVTNPYRQSGDSDNQNYHYSRATKISDRYGNTLNYQYDGDSLNPTEITGKGKGGLSRSISIGYGANGKISSITDPEGNTIQYGYESETYGNSTVEKLISVTNGEGNITRYGYESESQIDSTPKDPQGTSPTHTHFFLNVNRITDGNGNRHSFSYRFDKTRQSRINASWGGDYIVSGQPRFVASITLPGGGSSQFFPDETDPLRFVYQPDSNGILNVFGVAGTRSVTVRDAEGEQRRYDWSDPVVIDMKGFQTFLFPIPFDSNYISLAMWEKMTVSFLSSGNVEIAEYDSGAGLAEKSFTDISGNTTGFEYNDTWTVTDTIPWLPPHLADHPIFVSRYSDPTAQVDRLGNRKTFKYFGSALTASGRVMWEVVDEEDRKTEYTINPDTGVRTLEKVFDPENILVKETSFDYEDARFPAFMTSSVVKDGTTGGDLVTTRQADAYGNEVQNEIGGVATHAATLVTTSTYDLNGNKLTSTDGRLNTTTFIYDGFNRLTETHFPTIGGVTAKKLISYDGAGNKVAETDEEERVTIITYDARNRPIRTKRLMGPGVSDIETRKSYNRLSSVRTETDPRGYLTFHHYDSLQRITETIEALGTAKERSTLLFYDGGNNGSILLGAPMQPTRTLDARGFSLEVVYDAMTRPVIEKVEYQIGSEAVTVNTYDKVGNLTTVTDPLNHLTNTDYDALNRPFKVTHPNATFVSTTYTPADLVVEVTNERGHRTETEYDAVGRPVYVIQPDPTAGVRTINSPVTQTVYDAAGNPTGVIDPRGHRTDTVFDARNRPITVTAPEIENAEVSPPVNARPFTQSIYDRVGNVVSVTDPRGNITTSLFDHANRPIRIDHPAVLVAGQALPISASTLTEYDDAGNILKLTDENAEVTINQYDALNQLVSTKRNPQQTTSEVPHSADIEETFSYDAGGNRNLVVDGEGLKTRFEYDGLARLFATVHDADTAEESIVTLEYNAINSTARVDAEGRRTEFDYDVRNRPVGVRYIGRSIDDRSLVLDAVGNLLEANYPNEPNSKRRVVNTWDALNRQVTTLSNGQTHQFTFDKSGNPTQKIYGGSSTKIDSTFNALNLRTTCVETDSGATVTRTTTFGYNLAGQAVETVFPHNATERSDYDGRGRVTSVVYRKPPTGGQSGAELYRADTSYDLVGNAKTIDESWPGGTTPARTVTNSYDKIYRLTQESILDTSAPGAIPRVTAYQYNKNNSRTQRVVSGAIDPAENGATSYNYGDGANGAGANQLKSQAGPGAESVTYGYDDDGNRTTKISGGQTDTYAYDYENRLLGLDYQTGSDPAEAGNYGYSYDHRTRRIERAEPGNGTTDVIYSGGVSVQERDSTNGNLEVEFVRSAGIGEGGGPVRSMLYSLRIPSGGSAPTPSVSAMNQRGDVVGKIAANGQSLDYEAAYLAFGNITAEAGATEDRQKANTKEQDPHGLINDGMRYRDAETGTFLSRDPAGFVDGPNLYAYVRQNPWSKFDPLGLLEVPTSPAVEIIRQAGKTAAKGGRGAIATPVGAAATSFVGVGVAGSMAGAAAVSLHFKAKDLRQRGSSGASGPTMVRRSSDSQTETSPQPLPRGKDQPGPRRNKLPGKVSVHVSDSHAAIEVSIGGSAMRTHQVVNQSQQGGPESLNDFMSEITLADNPLDPRNFFEGDRVYSKRVSRKQAVLMQTRQAIELAGPQIPYSYPTSNSQASTEFVQDNTCVSHCKRVLQTGGLFTPSTTLMGGFEADLPLTGFTKVK